MNAHERYHRAWRAADDATRLTGGRAFVPVLYTMLDRCGWTPAKIALWANSRPARVEQVVAAGCDPALLAVAEGLMGETP